MNWETQIKEMVGKSFRRQGESETVYKYFEKPDGLVEILTDVDDYEMRAEQVPAFLASFKPLSLPSGPAASAVRPAKRVVAALPNPSVAGSPNLKLMQDALMSALARVQEDPAYVPQAEQVGRLIQTGINLAKVELEAIRLTQSC